MKKKILFWALNNFHKLDSSVKKKIYLALGILSVFFVLVLGVTVYVGFKAVDIVATKASETTFKEVQSSKCFNTLISKLDLNVWLTTNPEEHFGQITSACLGNEKSSPSNGG